MCLKYHKIFIALKKSLGKNKVFKNYNLKNLTTLKIGGNAKIFIEISSDEDIYKAIIILKNNKLKYAIMGNGSNLLVDSSGFRGAILHLSDRYNNISNQNGKIQAQAGVKLKELINYSIKNNLAGLENLAGIPASLGGAIYMNAGAYGKSISDYILYVVAIVDGKVKLFNKAECEFGYRQSVFQRNNGIIIRAELDTNLVEDYDFSTAIKKIMEKRIQSQPLEFPSAGSVFKKCEVASAGELIDKINLKGYAIGGVEISKKHANFFVNKNNANSSDYINLVVFTQQKVLENYGIKLVPEIKYLGDRDDIW